MRLSRTEFDSVKQMCGEMLVELLQHDTESILEMNGLEVIVRAIQPIVPTLTSFMTAVEVHCMFFVGKSRVKMN